MRTIDREHGTPSPSPTDARPGVRHLPSTRAWLAERIDGRYALALGVTWWVMTLAAGALEPETHHEVPVIATVLNVVMWGLILGMAVGLVARRRWGFAVSLGAAAVATAASVACPTTGHHAIGGWWFAQMACVLVLVGASVAALRSGSVSGDREAGEELAGPSA
jgi:peptidoglycan/LPS O-acetylase OafA/YrhL